MKLFQYIRRGIAWPDATKDLQSYVELRDRELEQYLRQLPQGNVGYGVDTTPRGSSGGSGPAAVVFAPVTFTCVPNRLYRVSWHASYVRNTDAGVNQVIVQFGGVGGVIQNAVVAVWAGGAVDHMDAWMEGRSDLMFPVGSTLVQVLATATAGAGFQFQVGSYGSYLAVDDMGSA